MPLAQGVEATCRRWRMFTPGTRALVAVSGGPDSVALLLVLHELAARLELSLGVAHLNHGIRGAAADRDEAFVRQLAGDLDIPFHSAQRDVPSLAAASGMSIEEAARTLRYDFLRQTASREGYDSIAVGHTEDDQAETVLIALIRGSGVAGLGGMPAVLGQVVRPLVESSRADVLAYLEGRGAVYCHDETNDDLAYTRNRVRHVLIPLLEKEFNPSIRATLARNAVLVQDDDAWLRQLTLGFLAEACRSATGGEVHLDREALAGAPPALRRRALREAVSRLGGGRQPPVQLSAANVEDMVDVVVAGRTGARLDLPGGVRAELEYGQLVLRAQGGPTLASPPPPVVAVEHELSVPGALSATGPGWEITTSVNEVGGGHRCSLPGGPAWQVSARGGTIEFRAYLDLDRLAAPLLLRTRKRGDRFWPQGAPGERKLKDFLIGGKVPRAIRDRLPLLCDASGRICAVLPLRAADWATVGAGTQRVLVLEGRIVTAPGVDREHPA